MFLFWKIFYFITLIQKLSVNTLVLAAVFDRGVNNKYLIANLNRNKKAYIQKFDISDNVIFIYRKF